MAGTSGSSFVTATSKLVVRFRKQRPLRAGSLLVTILGDCIAPRGGRIALASLIRLAQPFGLTDRLVRTSIGRLAQEDWVSSDRSGRASYYSLTAHGKARFAEATQRIYSTPSDSWDGSWTLVFLPRASKADRETLRAELSWMGFGQITPGVFAHPTHREDTIKARLAELAGSGRLIVMQSAQQAQPSDAQLVELGWDFGELARRYRRFMDMFAPVDATLSGTRSPPDETAFVLRTLLMHEYRKIHLRDPLLPARLLPEDWVGHEAQALCRQLYARVFPASERFLSENVQTLDGALPAPSAEIFRRFGGLGR